MRSSVVIKSSKAGMTVILDSQIPFSELLEAVGKKFRESARFWGAVQMTLTLEGRPLTAKEELQIVDTITRNSQIEVLCLLDTDAQRIERCEKALNDKLMELNSRTGQFYRGTLAKGDVLESEVSVVVIGDVEHGIGVLPEDRETINMLNAITRQSQSSEECLNCPISSGCGWCSAYNYESTGTPNKRVTYICPMHKARVMATSYYLNRIHRLKGEAERFSLNIPREWAVPIVGEDEYEMLLTLSKK